MQGAFLFIYVGLDCRLFTGRGECMMNKRLLASIFTSLLLFAQLFSGLVPVVQAEGVSLSEKVDIQLQETNSYFQSLAKPEDEWDAFALYLANQSINQHYVDEVKEKIIKNRGEYRKTTDLAGSIIGLNAAGQDPQNIDGINLIQKLYTRDISQVNASNDAAWALIALDSNNYSISEHAANITKGLLIADLVDMSLPDGGWSLTGAKVDPDITGMVMTALGPYKDNVDVNIVLQKASEQLKTIHPGNSNSIAQVILGLTTAGIDPTSNDYTYDGKNLIEQLLEFAFESDHENEGQFRWDKDDTEPNQMATQQALFALKAYHSFMETGHNRIFQDINGTIAIPQNDEVTTVDIRPLTSDVAKGETVQLIAEAKNSEGEIVQDASFIWSSSNPDIADVNKDGLLSAKEVGTTTITVQLANDETIKADLEISILPPSAPVVIVKVEGPENQITEGQIEAVNALEALEKLLTKKQIEYQIKTESWGKYVSSINHIDEGTYGGYDGWRYLIKRNDEWVNPSVGMPDFQLQPSDEVVVYYGDDTAAIESVSTAPSVPIAGQPFAVTVRQVKWVWNNETLTSDEQISPAVGVTVKINDQTIQTNEEGKAVFENGLLAGNYTIEVTDYEDGKVPSHVREVKSLTVAPLPKVTVHVEGPENQITEGQVEAVNALEALEKLLTEKQIDYHVTTESWGKYVDTINHIEAGTYGGYDGWSYLIKRNGEWISPSVGMPDFQLQPSDQLFVYYGDDTAAIKSISVSPSEPEDGESFTVTIQQVKWVFDWETNTTNEQVSPAANVSVKIGDEEIQTNAEGKATFSNGISAGDYEIEITGYQENKAPKIVRITQPLSVTEKSNSDVNPNPAKKTVKISVKGDDRGTILSSTSIEIETGDTVYDVLIKAMGSSKVEATGSGSSKYVVGIDGLYEFDKGPKSGWMVSINGKYIEKSAGSIKVYDGDKIVWKYTSDLGEDIGAPSEGISPVPQPSKDAAPEGVPTQVADSLSKLENKVGINKPITQSTNVTAILNLTRKMSVEDAENLKKALAENNVVVNQTVSVNTDTSITDSKQETHLVVPKGALKEGKTISIKELSGQKMNEVFSSIYEFSPAGTTFEKPVYLSIKVPLEKESTQDFVLAWLDEKENKWVALPTVIDAKTGIVTGKVNHFTKFAVIDKSQVADFPELSLVKDTITKTVQYILSDTNISDWEAFALIKAGAVVPSSYIQAAQERIKEKNGVFRKITDYERLVLAVESAGYDPENFAGYHLLEKIYDAPSLTNQGTNGLIFALIAMDSGNYSIPENAKWSREKMIELILNSQDENGGFPLTDGEEANIDITGMALSALAPYKEKVKVKAAIEKGVKWLSSMQDQNGGYSLFGVENSDSIAQTIIALATLGMNPRSEAFTKKDGDLITSLLDYQTEKGGFKHLATGEEDEMATEQALMALVAYERFLSQKPSIYDGVYHEEEKVVSIYHDDASLATWTREAVYKAKEYGLMEGASGYFYPQRELTRAEFTKVLVNLVGSKPNASLDTKFHDVKQDSWYYGYVMEAEKEGIIQGFPNGNFKPGAFITRQEIAIMITRAFQLNPDSIEISYRDVNKANPEVLEALQAMKETGIMVGVTDEEFRPYEKVSREMAAVIAVRLYELMQEK